ncbi:hypothetical protein BR63_17350 [Thermanaerosceptrum fracticalcis]|uniref:Uncharacterized protein n=1 Tax=Thermanaerosceptrum fracticalcis TaxID=1712410 RepID=A0A7G6E8U0_THEFR|nr:hypothetical protein BR63_17350 [Thermanaerosceptrum fracticalcis]
MSEGKRAVEILYLEADGVFIGQQRSEQRKAEVKLVTCYVVHQA